MLGQFEFSGFKKARRGEVRIDVTFEINSDGIVNVTACDQETGQQASTQITLSSGLSEDEISQIIDEGRTDRVRGAGAEADSQAAVAATSPAPPAEEELSDELELLPDAGDLLEEPTDLEVDDDLTALDAAEVEDGADPNAATQPELEPLDVDAVAETAAEVEIETEEAAKLPEFQPPESDSGIQVNGMDGSPDDEVEVQSGAESLFDSGDVDLAPLDDESER